MNRNVESHFSQIPSLDIQRSVFDRSCSHKTSFDVGSFIPIYVDEVLPGDTFDMSTSKVVRLQTLLDPIMDNMYLDTYFFFVPNRLVWDSFKQFFGEDDPTAWNSTSNYVMPVCYPENGGTIQPGSIADYLGLPLGVTWSATDPLAVNHLPFRGLALIYDEFFRDQNTMYHQYINKGPQATKLYSTVDNPDDPHPYSELEAIVCGGKPPRVCKYHDYFTSCLKAPQKGPPVATPVDIPAIPIMTGAPHGVYPYATEWRMYTRGVYPDVGTQYAGATEHVLRINSGYATYSDPSGLSSFVSGVPSNLWFPGTNNPDLGEATGASITVNDMRIAFQLQKYYERLARGGTRYSEYIRSQFSTDVPDARVQRPEYLGGNRIALSVHEVTNNSQNDAESSFLGDLGAMSVTADRHSDFIHSFTEHGFLFGVCCVRYDHSYSQGIERFWTRKHPTDYYLPVFANIGEQPVYQSEIFATSDNIRDKTVFGYQEAWADYRYKPNRISGEMRPDSSNSLASWHLGDDYDSAPILSSGWIKEDPSNVDRCLAVDSSVANQVFADFYFDCRVTRPMPMYSIPGLIDHN